MSTSASLPSGRTPHSINTKLDHHGGGKMSFTTCSVPRLQKAWFLRVQLEWTPLRFSMCRDRKPITKNPQHRPPREASPGRPPASRFRPSHAPCAQPAFRRPRGDGTEVRTESKSCGPSFRAVREVAAGSWARDEWDVGWFSCFLGRSRSV